MNKVQKVYQTLLSHFGPQSWWPTTSKQNPKLEICIGAILTQNTSWSNVKKSIMILKEKKLFSVEKLSKIPEKELASLIISSGYYNQKARKIKIFIDFLKASPEITRNSFLSLWGIGKETADSILLYAYNHPIFVIDAYTKRIFKRTGFRENDYDSLQSLFHKSLKADVGMFREYHALLVMAGKNYCKTRPLCNECPLSRNCKKLII